MTVDEAVGVLLRLLPEEEQTRIAQMEAQALSQLHLGLGMWIRNNFGLWQGNHGLLDATEQTAIDDASGFIVDALWKRLRENVPKLQ